MKKYQKTSILRASLVLAIGFICASSSAQLSKKDRRLVEDSQDAKKDFIHTDSLMNSLFATAYGYALFPTIGKGAFVVGGAGGDGVVFQGDSAQGKAQMSQLSVGLQAGGQSYREVIFFQNKETLDRFKENKVEFSAQISAVAAKSGASANVKYVEGIMVFTQQKGGLMFEASVGGQKFKYTSFK
ncbi:MAG TPA: YSC84-related protein [Puia sp.]|nr:YSC84-related protein [Puia sp.]